MLTNFCVKTGIGYITGGIKMMENIDGLCITFLANQQPYLVSLLTPRFKLEFLAIGINNQVMFHRTVGHCEYQATVTRYREEKDFRKKYVKLDFYGQSSRFLLELDILEPILGRAIGCPRLDVKVWHNTVITNQDLVLFYAYQMKREMFQKEKGKRYQKMQMLQSKEGDVSIGIGSRGQTTLYTRISNKYLELELTNLNKQVLECLKNGTLKHLMNAKLASLSSQLVFSDVTSSLHRYTSFAHFTRFKKHYVNNRKKHKMYNLATFTSTSSNHTHMLVELCVYLFCLNHTDCIYWDERNNCMVLELKFVDFLRFFEISNPQPYRKYLMGLSDSTRNFSIIQRVTMRSKDKYRYFTIALHGQAFWCCSNDFTEFNSRRFSRYLPSLPKTKKSLLVFFDLLTHVRCTYPNYGIEYDFTEHLPKALQRRIKFYETLNSIIHLLENSQIIEELDIESPTRFSFKLNFFYKILPKKS